MNISLDDKLTLKYNNGKFEAQRDILVKDLYEFFIKQMKKDGIIPFDGD